MDDRVSGSVFSEWSVDFYRLSDASDTGGRRNIRGQAVWALAEFDPKTCELKLPDTHSYVDYGLDLCTADNTGCGRKKSDDLLDAMPMAVTDRTTAWHGTV